MRIMALLIALMICVGCAAQATKPPKYRWTQFVTVEGQPEPIPAEWVATPEGKFAHSLKLPHPLPKDSGYRPGMSSEQYFDHLCKTEAGEFIYKTVENIEGFYFMRPPNRPTDDDLKDRYRLEAPEIERTFQLLRALPQERAKLFIAPPFNNFTFIEERKRQSGDEKLYVRAFGYRGGKSAMQVEAVSTLKSRYGLTWRGIKRTNERELYIAGGEWIVLDLETNQVLAVMRNYGRTGTTVNAPEGIWWLNAISCRLFAQKYKFATGEKLYDFTTKVIQPVRVSGQGENNGK